MTEMPSGTCIVPVNHLRFDGDESRGGQPRSGTAAAAEPGVPALLGSIDGVDVRRPGFVGCDPAHRRPCLARAGLRDGRAHRAAVAAQPAVRTARRGLGGPAGQAAPRHDPRRHRPRRGVRDDTAVLRAARADLRADVRGHVRGRLSIRAVHRVRRDAVRVDRGERRVCRRPVADLREPGAFLSRRPVRRRAARAGAERAVRHRGGRPVVPRVGLSARPDPAGGAARRQRRRRPHRRAALHRRLPDRR